jgi:septal ring factor EnvC (AmiA/AmiB activator)
MDDLPKIVGIIAGATTVLAATIRWGIAAYFKKAGELEALKEQWTKDALSQLKTATTGLRTDLCDLRNQLVKIEDELNEIRLSLSEMVQSHTELKNRTRQFKGTKLVRLSEDLFVLKKKE